jgi:hypothetical protein
MKLKKEILRESTTKTSNAPSSNDYRVESKSCSLELRNLIETMREKENQLNQALDRYDYNTSTTKKVKKYQSD